MEEYPMIVTGNFGETPKGKAPAKMLEKYICANTVLDQTAAMDQHVYLPSNGKLKVISSEKVFNKTLNTAGIVLTVEVTQ